MASVERRGDSYRITVSCGYSADGSRQIKQSMTWKPSKPNLTPKQLEKALVRSLLLSNFNHSLKATSTTLQAER